MNDRKMAFTILLVLLLQVSVPMIPADAASGRAVPDFSIDMTLAAGGSVNNSGVVKAALGNHSVEIAVSNDGSNSAEVVVKLFHKATSSSAETQVISIGPSTMASGETRTFPVDWVAFAGDGQSLIAQIIATDDSDVTEVNTTLAFDVSPFKEASIEGNDIPSPDTGFTDLRLGHTTHTFSADVANNGNIATTAVMEIKLVNDADPNDIMFFWSATSTMEPGSLSLPASDATLSVTFDATSMIGSWQLTSRVMFNSTGDWRSNISITSVGVTLSDYIISISAPSDRATEPGTATTLTWLISNLGSDDVLNIVLTSDQGWHDNALSGQTISILAGESSSVVVAVTVPGDAVKPTLENVNLDLTSTSSDPYTVRSTGHVIVGDTYGALVTAVDASVDVTPANTNSILFKVKNAGTMPSAFTLATGLTIPAEGWDVSLSNSVTPVLAPNSEYTISAQVTPAPISSPLKISEKNAAGDSLSLWLSATPLFGGVPNLDTTQLIVEAIITVDPGPETLSIVLDPAEVWDANGAGGIDRVLSLAVEVRHNLGNSIVTGVDAELTVGTTVFTGTNSVGVNEPERWDVAVTPASVSNLDMDEVFQSWLLIDGPGDELPLSGEIVIPITATPTLTQSQIDNAVNSSSVTRNITITVPSIFSGEIYSDATADSAEEHKCVEGTCNADVGNLTNFSLGLENTGNDITSYRLNIVNDYPDSWDVSLVTSQASNPTMVTNLSPAMADHPNLGTGHLSSFTLKVKTDPQANALTLQPITIRVEDQSRDEILSNITLLIRVEESINFVLRPTNDTISLSPFETPATRVYINNTGNIATTFSLWLDTSQQNGVAFTIDPIGTTEVIVGAGRNESVKIRLIPLSGASADELHMATLWVSTVNGMNLSAVIVANITADHHLGINVQDTISVTPGVNETIPVNFANTGNLEETLDIVAVVEGNWSASWEQDQITLPIGSTLDNDLTIVVPSLGGEQTLVNGAIHDVTISLYHAGNGDFLSARTISLVVAPVFLVQIDNWPEQMLYHRYQIYDWNVTVTNVGNKDVTVELDYDVFKPGLVEEGTISLAWEVVSTAPNTLVLPMNVPVQLSFEVQAKEFEPGIYLEALLQLKMEPSDTEIIGSTIHETDLKMSRLFSYQDYKLQPSSNNQNLTEDILWSHIPEGSDSSVTYLIELCDAQRRVNLSQLGLSESDFTWNFGLDVSGTTETLDLDNDCDNGAHSVITLPNRESWVTTNPLEVVIDTPNRPHILKNDGYDLTFRLYHPDENQGFTVYTEATFSFYFAAKALPGISELSFSEDTLQEGKISSVNALLSNDGTSVSLSITAELFCEGVSVLNPIKEQAFLSPGDNVALTWDIETDHLDWWAQSSDVSCQVELNSRSWNGESINPLVYKLDGEIESWSPGVGFSFIATLVLIGASIGLLRLVGQNDKFRLAATYSGLLALGFSFHLMDYVWWGPGILTLSALWLWTMTWKSSVEFQLIHEDYQRARKGISTLYSDHFVVLSNAKRQLSIILAMPALGMIGVILGVPPQMNPNSSNMISLVGYLFLSIVGVIFIIWNANRMYGSLYGRLTEVELQASRIERDLGDPARLLTELASDGLDLSAIMSKPQPNVAAVGEASSSEVGDWDDEIDLLIGDEGMNNDLDLDGINDDLLQGNMSDTNDSEVKEDG